MSFEMPALGNTYKKSILFLWTSVLPLSIQSSGMVNVLWMCLNEITLYT